ncbi:hypothetical protein CHD2B1_051 [Escherichia phage vB_EcoS-CHD2B1]|nr:hypothetical protein CHD2B1_051 [Escherichia phage vB_EcoS-CHD2B1]
MWQSGPPARLHASNIISDKNNRKIRLQFRYWLHYIGCTPTMRTHK